MIDIRFTVAQIVAAKDAKDKAAYGVHVHNHVRTYGQELLLNLANAIIPSSPEETNIVQWLQAQLIKHAQQIPEALSKQEPPK